MQSFFVSGQQDVDNVLSLLSSLSLDVNRHTALDYGCGVGRLTRALGKKFQQVTGVDVSLSMIKQAKELNSDMSGIQFKSTNDFFQSNQSDFDIILSLITLQHIERMHILPILTDLAGRLAPGGKLIFQLPSHPKGLEALHYIIKRSPLKGIHQFYSYMKDIFLRLGKGAIETSMNMEGIKPEIVEAALEDTGLEILYRERDNRAGPHWDSYIYIGTK